MRRWWGWEGPGQVCRAGGGRGQPAAEVPRLSPRRPWQGRDHRTPSDKETFMWNVRQTMYFVKLRQGSDKDRQGMALNAKGLKA